MTFSEVYNLILESCPFLNGNLYDGIIVKKLAATNTISDTGSSHQSHMAFTGKQKDFFPFLEADGYFNVGYDSKDDDLKKYFTLRIPLNIYAENVNLLSQEKCPIEFNSTKKIVRASVLRSRRKDQEDQVELSIKSLDDKDFIEFRKLLRVDDFFILLKKQNILEYDLVGILGNDKNAGILTTCTDFYKQSTQTPVDIDIFKEVDVLDSSARENQFVSWLNNKRKNDGSVYNQQYLDQTVRYLKYQIDKLLPSLNIGNLFVYDNVKAFEQRKSSLIQDDTFKKLNAKKNNQLSAALSLYGSFLQEVQNNNSISSLQNISLAIDLTPSQIIYYGVPGCGKSYEVNKVINAELDKYGVTDKEYHKVRCVFHPEYCNADFVGQIYPYVKPDNDGVEYRFKPGPFAEIVRRAYRNPAEPFFLVIEEINRGNAAAIFGEMFQLLDRIRPEDGPEELSGNIYDTGWSSYGVTNIDVNAYIRQKSTDNPEKIEYDDSVPYGDKIKFINNTAVRLPPNLSIYATMNTNDQNVFTMDNAFQRRFKSKMIRNVLDENSAQYKTEIDDTGVYWGDFRKWINEKILLPQTAVLKADDKCLGGWFITGEKINGVDKIKKEDFAEKVLKYLWDDVFKRNKSGEIFVKDDKVNSLSDLIDAFEMSVGFESFEKIFKMNDVDKAKLQKQVNT